MNTIDINLKYPMPDKTPHEKLEYYWPKIVDAVNVASSCCGAYLNNSKWKLEDDSIIVDVVQGAVFLMKYKKIDKLIEDLINSRLDIQMPVRFREVPDIEFAEKCEKATEFYTNMAMKYVGANAEKTEEEKKAEKRKQEVELHILAAASMTDALTEISKTYKKEHENVKFVFNF